MRLALIHIALFLPLASSEIAAQANPPAPQRPEMARPAQQPGDKLPDIIRRANERFDRVGRGRGTGYKPYMRGEDFTGPRSYPSGDLANITALTWTNHFRTRRSPEFLARRAAAVAAGVGIGDWRPVRPVQTAKEKEGGDIGRINAIAFHPSQLSTLYIGSPAAGLWRTQDDGATWKALTNDLPMTGISDIAIDPISPDTIYILTGDGEPSYARLGLPSLGIMKSVDGGQYWQKTGLAWGSNERQLGHRLAIHPTTPAIMLAATTAGLLRTTNGWDTWTTVRRNLAENQSAPAVEFWDVLFHPADPSIVYAASTTHVYRSKDAGQTWTPLAGGLPDVTGRRPNAPVSNRIRLAVTLVSPDTLYVLYGSDDGFSIGLYRSDNGGSSFEKRSASNRQPADPNNPPPFDLTKPNILGRDVNDFASQSEYDLAMAISPDDVDFVHVGGVDTWRSADGGRTWEMTSKWDTPRQENYTHADIHVLAYRGKSLYAATDGGLYRSPDAGKTWSSVANIVTGISILQIYALCVTPQDPNLLLYGAQDHGTYKLRIDGEVRKVMGGDGFVCQINPKDSRYVYASLPEGEIRKSSDGGQNFSRIEPPHAGNYSVSGAWLTPYILSPADPYTIYACYADLWRGSEPDFRWKNLTNGALGPSRQCQQVVVAPSDPDTIYVAKQGQRDRATDSRAADPRTPFLGGGGVFRSIDGGATWQTITGDLPLAEAAITNMAVSPTQAVIDAGAD